MKIEWNTVTWYSKLLALALFVALPFIGFYYGTQYGKTIAGIDQMPTPVVITTPPAPTSDYYQNPAEWQTDANNTAGGFSIAYPIDFEATDHYSVIPSTQWRVNANNANGVEFFTLTVPRAFEPQTNFADAMLTIGGSKDKAAVAQCVASDQNGEETIASSSVTINGIAFTVFTSASAGAGNLYETTSYRTMYDGECYAIEYTVHSSQIANYPASYGLQPFDEKKIDLLMQAIVGTFKFLG